MTLAEYRAYQAGRKHKKPIQLTAEALKALLPASNGPSFASDARTDQKPPEPPVDSERPVGEELKQFNCDSQPVLFAKHEVREIKIRLPLPNSKNDHWKSKVLPGCKFPLVYISAAGKSFIAAVQAAWIAKYQGWPPEPLTGRLKIYAWFCAASKREQDIHNRIDALMDALEKARVFVNDSQFDIEHFYRGPVSPPSGYCDVLLEVIPETKGVVRNGEESQTTSV